MKREFLTPHIIEASKIPKLFPDNILGLLIMAESSLYRFDAGGIALIAKHFAATPTIMSDDQFSHFAKEVVRVTNEQSANTPVEARAMIIAVLHRMIEYERKLTSERLIRGTIR